MKNNLSLSTLLTYIKYPLFSEKALNLNQKSQYTFIVVKKITKEQIKKIIEILFNTKVQKVNTLILPRQVSYKKNIKGYYPQYKKAIIKLKPGYTLTDLLNINV